MNASELCNDRVAKTKTVWPEHFHNTFPFGSPRGLKENVEEMKLLFQLGDLTKCENAI